MVTNLSKKHFDTFQGNLPKSLSVIVISFNPSTLLERCLTSLTQQIQSGIEIIVVKDWGQSLDAYERLKQQFQSVQWVTATPRATVPQMRRLGIDVSQAEIVALLEDDCVVSAGWCAAVLEAHQLPCGAIGGAVEPGDYAKALDWSVYFCEYVRFMQPFAGEVQALPGNNVSYRRSMLNSLLTQTGDQGFYEVFAHRMLQQAGQSLKADPALVVYNQNSWTLANISTVPFHHGRGFAGMRVAGKYWHDRLPFLGIAVILPLVQVSRITKDVFIRKRHTLKLLQALPGIVMFSISWSIGEFFGYLFGPGESLEHWC